MVSMNANNEGFKTNIRYSEVFIHCFMVGERFGLLTLIIISFPLW